MAVLRVELHAGARQLSAHDVATSDSEDACFAIGDPVDGRSAGRAEVIGHDAATVGCPLPYCRFAGDGDLIGSEPCLIADDRAGAALAGEAVAHGDTRWFAFDRQVKLPATAGGVSGTHGSNPQSVVTVGV